MAVQQGKTDFSFASSFQRPFKNALHMSNNIKVLSVICIPNGKLQQYYGSKILQAGKGGWKKGTDIRYKYAKEPRFVLLSTRNGKNIFRIEVLILDRNLGIKGLTGKELLITPYKLI